MKLYRNICLLAFAVAMLGGGPAGAQTECPAVMAQGAGAFVGMVSEQIFAGDAEYRRCELNKQVDAGVRLLRQPLLWRDIERARGEYDFSYWDAYVAAVASHGIQLMPIIFDAPKWRQERRPGVTKGAIPPKAGDMARFTTRLVRRYGPGGDFWLTHPSVPVVPIRVWQVWNEPNLPQYWGQKPNARQYVKLLRRVNRAIKRVDPAAEVVSAGIPDSTVKRSVPLYVFLAQMYAAGAGDALDTLAVNAYAEAPAQLLKNLETVRAIMRVNGDPARIWLTELGWSTGGPRHRFRVSRAQHAKLLRQSFQMLRRRRHALGIRGVVHYMWQDSEPFVGGSDFWGLYTGLYTIRGKEKPALRAFRSIARELRWVS